MVTEYVYLVILFQNTLSFQKEKERRFAKLEKAIATINHLGILKSGKLSVTSRRTYFRAMVISVALWGLELWVHSPMNLT